MKFKIDENLPAEIGVDLRATGHQADTVGDEGLTGAVDSTILARVQAERYVLLTLDKGMADVRAYPPQTTRASSCSVHGPPAESRRSLLFGSICQACCRLP